MENKDFSVIRQNGDLPDPKTVDTSAIIPDLWEIYYDSTSTLLSNLEAAAMDIEAGNNIEDNAAAIRRILHSLKGDSGVTGLNDIYELCHETEFAFEELSSSDAADMILKVKDWICEVIDSTRDGNAAEGDGMIEDIAETEKKIKTLVIDDEPVIRKHIEMLIGDFCDCTFASDGGKGFEIFRDALENSQPFELVTLDIEMPIMNGHETLERIRKIEKHHKIEGLDGVKVVMSTSLDDSKNVFSAFREGCEAYVPKNHMKDKLVEEIKNLGIKTPQTA
ncbi:MAG: response regulator [Planctomycetes bacterium]|nr:response regulator [Planctomycetota bacterium]